MTQHIFIYGNQPLELNESIQNIIDSKMSKSDQENSVFKYDVKDFFSSEHGKNISLIQDFQSTCETIPFFSSSLIIQVDNLQQIPLKKSAVESFEKKLSEFNLIKSSVDDNEMWFDSDTLTEQVKTHHHITGKQIVQQVLFCGSKTYYLELVAEWKNRLVHHQVRKKIEATNITEYLEKRFKENLVFTKPDEGVMPTKNTGGFVDLIKDYIQNPPAHVEFIFSANIKNTREINKEIYALLQQNAKELKKTIAYDDFRPVAWVIERATQKGLNLDRLIADLLIEMAGTEFSVLDMELEKLSILFPPNSVIRAEDLLKNTSHSKRFNIFRITNYLVQKNLKSTLESLELILKYHPSDSVSVFGLIASHFRRLLKIAWMQEKGVVEKNIISNLKINQWVARQAIKHTRNFTLRELENIVVFLAKCDLQIKYNVKDALIILENICFQICQGGFINGKHLSRQWVP